MKYTKCEGLSRLNNKHSIHFSGRIIYWNANFCLFSLASPLLAGHFNQVVRFCDSLGSRDGEGNGTPLQYSYLEKSHGWRSLEGCSPWGHWGSDTTEWLHLHFSLLCIGEGNGNPLQCSCLENPSNREAWWAAIYGVSQNRTRLKRLSSSSSSRAAEKAEAAASGLLSNTGDPNFV